MGLLGHPCLTSVPDAAVPSLLADRRLYGVRGVPRAQRFAAKRGLVLSQIAIQNFFDRKDVSRRVDIVDVERDPDLARELGLLLAGYLASGP